MARFGGILFIVGKKSKNSPMADVNGITVVSRPTVFNHLAVKQAEEQLIGKPLWYSIKPHAKENIIGTIEIAKVIHDMFYIEGSLIDTENLPISISASTQTLGLSFDSVNAHIIDTKASTWVIEKITLEGVHVAPQSKVAYGEDTLFWLE